MVVIFSAVHSGSDSGKTGKCLVPGDMLVLCGSAPRRNQDIAPVYDRATVILANKSSTHDLSTDKCNLLSALTSVYAPISI